MFWMILVIQVLDGVNYHLILDDYRVNYLLILDDSSHPVSDDSSHSTTPRQWNLSTKR